jgi:nucleotide-binding universal stress UspA family protein
MRILVPIDGSALSEAAIPYAALIARGADGDLILLTVGRAGESPDVGERRAALERRLNERIAALEAVRAVGYFAVDGEPARVIADAVAQQEVDLVVMSTHRRAGVERMLFGSVSEDVLDAVSVPVLLVRPAVEPEEDAAP